jgi:SPP1 family phage portal protein
VNENQRGGKNVIQLEKSFFDNLNKEKIEHLQNLAQPYFNHRSRLYERYSRKRNVNEAMSSPGGLVSVPFEYYVVNMAQGYLSGKGPAYRVSGGIRAQDENTDAERTQANEYQSSIDHVRRYNDDPTVFTELIHDYITTGAAYVYVSENEDNEIVYTRLDSRNTLCVYDHGTPVYPVALIRVWNDGAGFSKGTVSAESAQNSNRIEIITEHSRRLFNPKGEPVPFQDYDGDGNLLTLREKPLFWGDVPAVAFEHPDGVAVFEPAAGLIDVYESLMTNLRNMVKYNDNAKLLISGYSPENPMYIEEADGRRLINPMWKQEEKELYEASAVYLHEGGKMEWLIKDVNYSGILEVMSRIHEMITLLTGVPNMTDDSFSRAQSGVALGYKLYSLDQYCANTDRLFKKGYSRMWEIITARLNLREGADWDFRRLDISFARNTPADKDKNIERAAKAREAGLLSLETALAVSGVDVDVRCEMERIRGERFSAAEAAENREYSIST